MNNDTDSLYFNAEWRNKMEIRNEIRACIHEIRILKMQRDMSENRVETLVKFEDMIKSKYRELKNKFNQRKLNIATA